MASSSEPATKRQKEDNGHVIIGTLIDAPTPTALRIRTNTACVVNDHGVITQIIDANKLDPSWTAEGYTVTHLEKWQIICPGLIDMHIHAPQYKQIGTKTDIPLMKWLDEYTFPAESRFSSLPHATEVYTRLVQRLLRNGTTTAVYYGSNHLLATQKLADICGEQGQRALVGKTCADQLTPEYYVESTEQSLEDTETFIRYVQEKFGTEMGALVQPVVTPRFIPTCSDKLLEGLGALAAKYGCYIQSHAAESVDEEALVEKMHPGQRDVEIYQRTGLLGRKSILAHCCRLRDSEARIMAKEGAIVVSCPYSNVLFARATVPIPYYHRTIPELHIGLGTDIAGGWSSSLWENMRIAVLQDRADSFALVNRIPVLENTMLEHQPADWVVDFKYAFYLATMGGAKALGFEGLVGSLDVEKKFDAVMVDVNVVGSRIEYWGDEEAQEVFEKFVTGGDDRNIVGVWVEGRKVV